MVSYSERPSVNQRGTWFFDSWMANTCPSSCHSTLPQLNGSLAGLIAATTWPKHTPWMPMLGRPLVRTLKWSRLSYISTCTGTCGANM